MLFTVTARQLDHGRGGSCAAGCSRPPTPASARSRWRAATPRSRRVCWSLPSTPAWKRWSALWAFVFLIDAVALPTATAGLHAVRILGRPRCRPGSARGATERVGIWPMLAAVTIATVTAAALVATRLPVLAGCRRDLAGTGRRTHLPAADPHHLRTGARRIGGPTCRVPSGEPRPWAPSPLPPGRPADGTDTALFGGSVLALAILTSAGMWALQPGRRSTKVELIPWARLLDRAARAMTTRARRMRTPQARKMPRFPSTVIEPRR